MPDTSTERVRRLRGHRNNDHSDCDREYCEVRRAEEDSNTESIHAMAVLFAIEKRGGNAEEILGSACLVYRELASRESPDYLPQQPGKVDLIAANLEVREAMQGIPVIWLSEPDEDPDDFDPDAFFDQLLSD